jgi:transposase InsO family protein
MGTRRDFIVATIGAAASLSSSSGQSLRFSKQSPLIAKTEGQQMQDRAEDPRITRARLSGSAARPWLTIVIDDYSRAIAGYYLGFDAPSSMRTSLALRQGIWRKGHPHWQICGVPDILYTDNVLTQEGKAGEKRRSLSIPHGMCLTTTLLPSGFHEQGLSVRP